MSRSARTPVMLMLAGAPESVLGDGRRVPVAPVDAALLAWLALEGPTSRNRLAGLLWPQSDAEAARNTLRQRLFKLRRQFDAEVVVGRTTLSLHGDVRHDLQDADGVLDGVEVEVGGEYGDWLAVQRERRRARVRRSLAELCEMAETVGDWPDAMAHAAELLALEPLSEAAHRRVMRLHYLAGDRAAALTAFDRCEQVLKNDIGARPSAETLELLASIEAAGPSGPAGKPGAGAPPAAVLRPPRMIGRDAELHRLAQGWQAGHVVAVIGEAGLGKSRLLQDFASAQRGIVHVAARPGDAGVPLATLARLLRAVAAHAQAEPALEPATRQEIARVLPEFGAGLPRHAGEGQRLVLRQAVLAFLTAQAGLAGLLVDDLHFADEASLDMLRALIDEPGSVDAGRPHWALAYRPAEAATPLQALHDALTEQACLRPLPLRPLSQDELAELIDSLALPGVQGAALAPGLLQRTGGNPLFVLETLKQAWVEDTLSTLADVQRMPRPVSVGRLIERRIGQLSRPAIALARVASIAGVDFSIAMAEHVLQASAIQFADAINELESAQVMRGNAFAHDLVFDAVASSVPATVAQHTHAQVAAWLESHHGEPARIARHWRAANRPTQALPWLHRAAETALHATRPREAAEFLLEAADIELAGADHDAGFDTLARLVSLQHDNHQTADARRHAERLSALASTPRQRMQAALELGWSRFHADDIASAERLGDEVLTLAGTLGDALHAAWAHELLAVAVSAAERFGEAIAHLRSALPTLIEQGDAKTRVEVSGHLALLLDQQGRVAEALEPHAQALDWARELGDMNTLSIVMRNASVNAVHCGDAPKAHALLVDSLRCIAQTDGTEGTEYSNALLTAVCADLGRYGEALRHGDAALEVFGNKHVGWLGQTRTMRCGVWLHLGQWTRALQELDAPMDERIATHARARRLTLRARALAPLGQPVQALLDEALTLAPSSGRLDGRLHILLECMQHAPPDQVLALADQVGAVARSCGMRGFELWALVRSVGAAVSLLGVPELIRRRGRIAELADTVYCNGTPRAELWLAQARLAAAVDDDAAQARFATQGREWLMRRAAEDVPAPFRDTFLHRHPVHRELLAMATRLGR